MAGWRRRSSGLDRADAAIITASTEAHGRLVRAAIERGLPTFCEKPLAFDSLRPWSSSTSSRRATRPSRSASSADSIWPTGSPPTHRIRRARDRVPGPPDRPRSCTAARGIHPRSGGLFRDSSIHDFDALRWVTGQEVDEVYASGSVRGFPIFEQYDDVDTGAAILTLADGTLGVLSQTRHDPLGYDVRMEIVGSRDAVTVGLGQQTPLRSLELDAPVWPVPAWPSFFSRFESGVPGRADDLPRRRPRPRREPVHRARRTPGDAHRGGGRSLARRAPSDPIDGPLISRVRPHREEVRPAKMSPGRHRFGDHPAGGGAARRSTWGSTGGGSMRLHKWLALVVPIVLVAVGVLVDLEQRGRDQAHDRRRPGRRGRGP